MPGSRSTRRSPCSTTWAWRFPTAATPLFTTVDVAFVQSMAGAAAIGIGQGDALLHVVAGAMERMAEAAVAVYVQGPEEDLRRRWASVFDCARSNVEATELSLDLGLGLSAVFRHHMRQAIARQRVIQEGVSAASWPGSPSASSTSWARRRCRPASIPPSWGPRSVASRPAPST